jgi:arylsulfatase A-like enzyme
MGLELVDQARIRRGELVLEPYELDYVTALYDGGVRVVDGYLGRFLEALERLGLSEHTVVIVTSDHGEALGEREPSLVAEHGHSLYDELLHVPLFLHDPRLRHPVDVSTQVRSIDVLPTVLDLLEVPAPEGLDGRSLLPLVHGEETAHRPAFSRVTRKGEPQASLRDGRFKLIRELGANGSSPSVALYDLEQDPDETKNLAATSEATAPMQEKLDGFLAELAREGALDFSLPVEELAPELQEQLRALGYVE